MYKILVINPGSTSTKIAVFEDEVSVFVKTIPHDAEILNSFLTVKEQTGYRKKLVLKALDDEGMDIRDIDIVMGIGGIVVKPKLAMGGYKVDESLYNALQNDDMTYRHASQYGGLIGKEIADEIGVKAYIYDCVTSADLTPIARITGMPDIERRSFCHVLNGRAIAIKYAEGQNKKLEDLNLIVAHMGGGCSVMVFSGGLIIESMGDDDGHFCPERSGSIPALQFIDVCLSGKYTRDELRRLVRGKGGMYALLGTSDCVEIEKRIADGDKRAEEVYEAQAYQLAKAISLNAVPLKGNVDAIILTGGIANSEMLTSKITDYIKFIAPVVVMPGEKEMEALALGGLRILRGEEKAAVM